MMVAHATIPLIIYGLFPNHISLLALLFGSGFPNFDVFPTLLRKKTPKNTLTETHASTILHTFFLYIMVLPILYFLLNSYGIANGGVIAISFSLGGWIHVLSESFDEKGRRLLYPFSKKFYGVRVLPYDFWTYLTNKKILAFEGLLLAIACALLLV
jgi:membrane-bound metal-dependent hydrolase YbcI (DUF457 family)